MTRRVLLPWFFLGLTALADTGAPVGEEPPPGTMDSLRMLPDLRPQLISDELVPLAQGWPQLLDRMAGRWSEERFLRWSRQSDGTTALHNANTLLAPCFEHVTRVVLYSLYPQTLPIGDVVRSQQLESLSKFHGYPIFGSVVISDDEPIRNWTAFLQHQIIPGESNMCDFSPRHGFTFERPEGDVDMLMCFHCSGLSIFPRKVDPRGETRLNPHFSPAVQIALDALFEKNKIETDSPR